jgi:Protein of unknown function (DUF2541)
MNTALHLPIKWAMTGMFLTSAIATSLLTPVSANANPIDNARRACSQAAYSRGYRVTNISEPYFVSRNRVEATVTVRQRGGGGWNGGWNREESLRCEYNDRSGQVSLDQGYAGNPNDSWGRGRDDWGRNRDWGRGRDDWGRDNWGAPGQPRLLGEARLGFRENNVEEINVDGCRPGISQLQIRARRAPVDLNSLRVRFGNGDEERLGVPSSLAPRQSTGWIDLPGRTRCLRQIRLKGDTRDFADREGVVEIWGR